MKPYFLQKDVIRALPSKRGGYNISPQGGISFPKEFFLTDPYGGGTIVQIGTTGNLQDDLGPMMYYLSKDYTISSGRLSEALIDILGVRQYINSLLEGKNKK